MNIFKPKGKLYDIPVEVSEELKKDAVVSCGDCSCLVLKEHAQEIKVSIPYFGNKYYCQKCKKPYSRISCDLPILGSNIQMHYWAEKEVDKNGKVIK